MKRGMVIKDKFAGMSPALIYKGIPVFYMNPGDVLYGCKYKEFFPNTQVDASGKTLGCLLSKGRGRKREIYGIVVDEFILHRDYKGEELRAKKLAIVYHEFGHKLGNSEIKAQKWAIEQAYEEGASKALTILVEQALCSSYSTKIVKWLLEHPVFSKIPEVHQVIKRHKK